MNFYVSVLTDGQWLGELVVYVEFVDGKLPLDFDHQIRTLVNSLYGISAWTAHNAETYMGEWL